MAEQLKIVIDGDVSGAVKEFKFFEGSITILNKQLERLQKIASLPNLSFTQQKRLIDLMGKTTSEIAKVKRGAEQLAPAFNKIGSASNSATLALTNVGRVAQDLPFGFLGIANNLNPLLESFQRLKAETGSTGKAFSALGASLGGAGGIGLGLSVVSSLLIVFGDKLFGAKAATEALNLELELLKSQIKQSEQGIKDFNDELDFLKERQNIKIDIGVADSGSASLLKLKEDALFAGKELGNLDNELTRAFDRSKVASDKFFSNASAKTLETIDQFGALADIPESIAEGFGKGDQKLFAAAKAAADNVRKVQEDITGARREQSLIRDRIGLQETKNLRDEIEKQKDAFEKFRNDIIARARQFTKEFGAAFVVPDLDESFFKNKEDIFKASKELLSNVRKFIAGDSKALEIKVPIQIETSQITSDVTSKIKELNKVIDGLKPVSLKTEGDVSLILKQLDGLNDKEITVSINQKGDVKEIASQLTKLKGVKIPVVIEENGNIDKIAERLKSLKSVNIKITSDVSDVLNDISKIKDISVSVKSEGVKELEIGIAAINKAIANIKPLKLTTEGDFKEVQKQLSELENKEIILKIDQKGDVTKIAEQLSKLKGVEIPITINDKVGVKSIIKKLESLKGVDLPVKITGDVDNVVKELSKIEGIKLSVSGDTELNKIIERLKGIQDKEITISIEQTGDISKIADQLTKLKGIKIPIRIEQQGDIQKIAAELKSLKSIDVKITGDARSVLTELSKIKDISVSVKLNESEALKKLDFLDREITVEINTTGDLLKISEQLNDLKGVEIPIVIKNAGDVQKIADELKNLKTFDLTITGNVKDVLSDLSKISDIKLPEQALPIIINENGIITQITRAVDGAIKVVQTKEIRIPVVTDVDIKIAEQLAKEVELSQNIIDNFFNGLKAERRIPVEVIPDLTLSKQALADIDKKLNLKQQFKIFGDFGIKEFDKIDFSNITNGINDATKTLQGMLEVATTLQQSIGQGLTSAFNAVFDSILEGKSVFKALGNAIKELVVGVIKAVAQMLILKAITSLIFPGAGAAGIVLPRGQFTLQANPGNLFGLGQQIGNRSFQNSLTVNVIGQISNDTIRLSNQRSTDSSGRYG